MIIYICICRCSDYIQYLHDGPRWIDLRLPGSEIWTPMCKQERRNTICLRVTNCTYSEHALNERKSLGCEMLAMLVENEFGPMPISHGLTSGSPPYIQSCQFGWNSIRFYPHYVYWNPNHSSWYQFAASAVCECPSFLLLKSFYILSSIISHNFPLSHYEISMKSPFFGW